MWSILEWIIVRIPNPRSYVEILAVDQDHRAAESIELLEGFALRGFDHQRPCDRERHGWRMKPIIDQSLGNVVDADMGVSIHRASVDDALVCDEPIVACIEDWIVIF